MIFDRGVDETGFRHKEPLHHSFGASEATILSISNSRQCRWRERARSPDAASFSVHSH